MSRHQTRVSIDCYVRPSVLTERADRIIETLRKYNECGVLTDLTEKTWPAEVPLADEAAASEIVAHYDLFQKWADLHGVSLAPAFTTRDQTTLVSDDPHPVLVLPMICLAIHLDGRLASVVPHSTKTTTYTVEDALTDLENADDVSTPVLSASDIPHTSPDKSQSIEHAPESAHPEADEQPPYRPP